MDEIVGITACIDYADYLAETLPQNRPLFTTYYIITEESDTATCELARFHNCVLLFTSKRHEKGAKFNKSGMIFDAQSQIHARHPLAWIVLLDADIYLPTDLWKRIDRHTLNKNGIYGLTRHVYNTQTDYVNGIITCIDNGELGVVGYFQLYWLKNKYYAPWSANCSHCDLEFMKKFRIQHTYPHICFHFGEKRKNWNGRVCAHWSLSS
jgi:hypothetical protein